MREFKNEIKSKLINIPSFIDTTNSTHYLLWQNGMLSINSELLKLISPKVLTEKTIFKIYLNINEILDEITTIVPPHIQLKVIAYYSKLFLYLEDKCIQYEFFESAANVKKYVDLYYQINPIK